MRNNYRINTYAKITITCLIIFLTIISQAQENDSVTFYRAKGFAHATNGKYFTAVRTYRKALYHLSENDEARRAALYYMMSAAFLESRTTDSAMYYLKKGNLALPDNPSNSLLCRKYMFTASNHFANGEIDQALEVSFKALEYSKKSSVKEHEVRCNYSIGRIFLLQKDYTRSSQYFQRALALAKKSKDQTSIANINCFLADIDFQNKRYAQAEKVLKECAQYYQKVGNKKGYLVSQSSLAKVYFYTDRMAEASKIGIDLMPLLKEFEYNNESKKIVENTDKIVKESMREQDSVDIQKAVQLTKENMSIGQQVNPSITVEQKNAFIRTLETGKRDSTIDSNILNQIEVDKEIKATQLLQDSIYQENLKSKTFDLETQYKTRDKEKENLALKLEKEKQTKQSLVLGLGLTAALLGLILFAFFYQRNKKQKEEIIALQHELHHRIVNNLSVIDEFIDKSMEEVSDQKTKNGLVELQSRVASINEVHQLLYKEGDVTSINMRKYLVALTTQVQNIYSNTSVHFEIDCAEHLTIPTNKGVHFGLIVNEFITNSFKYAFPYIDEPSLSIIVQKSDVGLEVNLRDNGPGFDQHGHATGYGTRIMELLAQKIQASYTLSGNNGASLHLLIQNA